MNQKYKVIYFHRFEESTKGNISFYILDLRLMIAPGG